MMTATCNAMVYQDDSHIRCYLPAGHRGPHEQEPAPPRLIVRAARRKSEVYEVDPDCKSISNGNGIFLTVPNWVAEAVERGWGRER